MENLRDREAPRRALNDTPPSEWRPSQRLLTTKQYERMIAAGIFDGNDRVELLEGVIIEMSPKGIQHAACTDRAARYFMQLLGRRVIVRNQNPIQLNDYSQPEPDLALVSFEEHEYAFRHPAPEDIWLILEVADTTLAYDRNHKGLSYSRAGITQYLLLNLKKMEIEDYREPNADGYGWKQTYAAGQSFDLVAFPGVTVKVSDLLPPVPKKRTSKDRGAAKAAGARPRKAAKRG